MNAAAKKAFGSCRDANGLLSAHCAALPRPVPARDMLLQLGACDIQSLAVEAGDRHKWLVRATRLEAFGDDDVLVVGWDITDEDRRCRCEQAVARISLESVTSKDSGEFVEAALAEIGEALQSDRVFVFEAENGGIVCTHEWCNEGVRSLLGERISLGGATGQAATAGGRGEKEGAVPPELPEKLRSRMQAQGIRSALTMPLFVDGKFWGLVGVEEFSDERQWHDSEVHLLQTAARILTLRLQAEVARRREAEYNEQLIQSEKRAAVGKLAAGVAHNFNNLLEVILGETQIMLAEGSSAEHMRRLERIEEAALRGADLAQRLGTYAHGPEDDRQGIIEDLSALVEDVVQLAKPVWKDGPEQVGVTIAVHKSLEPVPPCIGDRSKIADLVVSLIRNAVEVMPEGGDLTIKTWSEPGACCLSVTDSGLGMSEEVCRRAFDPFFTTKGPQSPGLGLTVAQAVVRNAGGEVVLESKPKAGTTAIVRLPIASRIPAVRRQQKPRAEGVAHEAKSLRILVADDDPAVLAVVRDVLELLGHRPAVADSGRGALQLAEREQFDLVITDLGMPGMTGVQLAQILRSQYGDLPVILLTGWGDNLTAVRENPALDLVLSKPITVEQLREAIDSVAAGSRAAC